jgi:hypothetical protein
MFEKRKWSLKRISTLVLWVDILNTCDFKCQTLQLCLYLHVTYKYVNCVGIYIFGGHFINVK